MIKVIDTHAFVTLERISKEDYQSFFQWSSLRGIVMSPGNFTNIGLIKLKVCMELR